MKKLILFGTTILFFLLTCFSCGGTDEQCRRDKYIVLTVDFKKAVIDTLGIQKLSNFSIDSVTILGLDNDSILYNNRKHISKADLYLNKFAEQTHYQFSLNDTIDTLTIWHKNTEEYLSFECGCIVTHLIDSITIKGHFIDSISIKNNTVNTLNATNIELYRRYNYYTSN